MSAPVGLVRWGGEQNAKSVLDDGSPVTSGTSPQVGFIRALKEGGILCHHRVALHGVKMSPLGEKPC